MTRNTNDNKQTTGHIRA